MEKYEKSKCENCLFMLNNFLAKELVEVINHAVQHGTLFVYGIPYIYILCTHLLYRT